MSVVDDEDRVFAARCNEAPDGWPFDADRDDPLTAHRIAVTCSHPGWRYLVAFDRESPARPDDHEVALLVSYLNEYKHRWYGTSGYRARMERRPLDVDGGANGVVFHKFGPDDWGYRRQSWSMGPLFWPGWDRKQAYGLAALMDHIHTILDEPSKDWQAWKAAHPEVFGR